MVEEVFFHKECFEALPVLEMEKGPGLALDDRFGGVPDQTERGRENRGERARRGVWVLVLYRERDERGHRVERRVRVTERDR
uniref:Uncharacterized protein n=1 Tax=Cannabis sativa TaxID=3483 RepID=A0A803QZ34_CANSA